MPLGVAAASALCASAKLACCQPASKQAEGIRARDSGHTTTGWLLGSLALSCARSGQRLARRLALALSRSLSAPLRPSAALLGAVRAPPARSFVRSFARACVPLSRHSIRPLWDWEQASKSGALATQSQHLGAVVLPLAASELLLPISSHYFRRALARESADDEGSG